MLWFQKTLTLPARKRGFHLVTDQVLSQLEEVSKAEIGFLQLFLQHTSASLTLNENADPDVRRDMELAMNHLCPENLAYSHTCEGPDDMPAHVKSSLLGPQLLLPIRAGCLALGTWQGIYLCEHRDQATSRRMVATLWGQPRS